MPPQPFGRSISAERAAVQAAAHDFRFAPACLTITVVQETERDVVVELKAEPADNVIDTPLERLELLAGDDAAISSFLDELDVRGPREREMFVKLVDFKPTTD